MGVATVDRVLVAPLAAAFLASGLEARDVAERMGWTKPGWTEQSKPVADGPRVRRALGLVETPRSARVGGGRYKQIHTHYDTALALAEAIGVDPVDVGL